MLFVKIINFTYICKGYIYEYKEASASNGRCLFYMRAHMTKPPDKQGACSMFMRLIMGYRTKRVGFIGDGASKLRLIGQKVCVKNLIKLVNI